MMTLTKYGIREWGVGLVAAVVLLAGCCWLGAAGHPGWGAGVGWPAELSPWEGAFCP